MAAWADWRRVVMSDGLVVGGGVWMVVRRSEMVVRFGMRRRG